MAAHFSMVGEEGVDPLLNCVAAGLDMKANCEGNF